jgi:DNA-binding IclR family transcriptional regulator
MVESRSAIRFSATIGTPRPLHSTAAGRALLAAQSNDWINQFLKTSALEKHTKETITKVPALRSEIAKIRRTGVCETHEEYSIGVSGFAAVIYDARSKPAAAVLIAAPTSRAKQERDRLINSARNAATAMSHILGAANRAALIRSKA